MTGIVREATGLAVAAVGGWLLPVAGIRTLIPRLEASSWKVTNYRGRSVYLGLGMVWAFWALGAVGGSVVLGWLGVPSDTRAAVVPAALVLLALGLGLADDVYGSHDARGLGGHLRAMLHGRVTTGGLKLMGIGLASVWAAYHVASARSGPQAWSRTEWVIGLVAAAALIAGSANLLNLLDLRPGRALKGYVALFALSWVFGLAAVAAATAAASVAFSAAAAVVWMLGPVAAVWRYDLSELGMLGDAGANAAGVLAGFALAQTLPLWGVVIAAVAVVGLNLVSERVSFTQVIDQNRVLAWVDELGRLRDDPKTPGPAS